MGIVGCRCMERGAKKWGRRKKRQRGLGREVSVKTDREEMKIVTQGDTTQLVNMEKKAFNSHLVVFVNLQKLCFNRS